MAERTQGPWKIRKWSKDPDTKEASGSVYALPREGHAYAVAMCPRYQKEDAWNADSAFIAKAVNNHDALVKALQFIVDGYANQNVNHVDFRVKAYEVAIDALSVLCRDPVGEPLGSGSHE